jgi:hypothetical protein
MLLVCLCHETALVTKHNPHIAVLLPFQVTPTLDYKLYRLHPFVYVVFNYFLFQPSTQAIWGCHHIKDKLC